MLSLKLHRRVAPFVAPLAAALVIGCTHWAHTAPTPDALAIASKARVTLSSGSRHEVHRASIQGDSLIGYAPFAGPRMAFALKDITTLHVERSDPGMTVALISGVVLAFVAVSLIVCGTSESGCFSGGF